MTDWEAIAAAADRHRQAVLAVREAYRLIGGHQLPALVAALEQAIPIAESLPIGLVPLTPEQGAERRRAMEQDLEVLRAALPLWELGAGELEGR